MKISDKPKTISYRQSFGLNNPPKGTNLKLEFMEGLKWYLFWPNCTDEEDIIEGWFATAAKARQYAFKNGWLV